MCYLCDCFCNHLINHTLQYTCKILHVVTETPKLLRCPGKTSRSKTSECYNTISVCTGLLSLLLLLGSADLISNETFGLRPRLHEKVFKRERDTSVMFRLSAYTKMALSKNRYESGAFSGHFCLNTCFRKRETDGNSMATLLAARSSVNRI